MASPTYRLAPELLVADLAQSLAFWRDLIGFDIAYDRPEEGFAFLALGPLSLMVEQQGPGRRAWVTAPLEPPLGRGVNFEITVPEIDEVLARLGAANWPLFIAPETKTYRTGRGHRTVRQFLVQDPDGYLLRLAEVLAET